MILVPRKRIWTPRSAQRGFFTLPGGMGIIGPAGGAPGPSTDHFSTTTFTADNTYPRTITTGVDVREGLVLAKRLDGATTTNRIVVQGTIGSDWRFGENISGNTVVTTTQYTPSATGFTLNAAANFGAINGLSGGDQIIWSFARLAGFMDVVRYTGNGSNRTISHSLGSAPGMVLAKRLNAAPGWFIGHRGISWSDSLQWNSSVAASTTTTVWNSTAPTSSVFSLGTSANVNQNTVDYVAYLFGHDTSPGGLIRCESYVGNGSASGPSVSLGWHPRWLMIKCASAGSTDWIILDATVNPGFSGNETLMPFNNNGTLPSAADVVQLVTGGFQIVTTDSRFNSGGEAYVVVAIR